MIENNINGSVSKHKKISKNISLFLITILSLTIIFISVYFVGHTNLDIRNLAMPRANSNSLILELTLDPNTKEVKVKDAIAMNNSLGAKQHFQQFLEKTKKDIAKTNDGYELIASVNQKVIQKQKLHFIEYLQSLPPVNGQKFGDPPAKLPEPVAVVQIDYQTGATYTVQYPSSNNPKPLSTARIAQAILNHQNNYANQKIQSVHNPNSSPNSMSVSSIDDGFLDILYIASNFTSSSMSKFTSEVTKSKDYIFSLVPYSNYKNKIRVWQLENLQNLGCTYGYGGIDRCLYCDYGKVMAAAQNSGIPYDTIMVLNNSTKYGGCAAEFAVSSTGISEYGTPGYVTGAHEFSHSFGELNDEYSYGGNGSVGIQAANCDDSSSCSKWRSYHNSCLRGCTFDNAYRPSNACMMLDLTGRFDPICQKALTARIQSYTATNQITPTNTPTLTPTQGQPGTTITPTISPIIPNCSNISGPTSLTIGTPASYQANFTSTAGNLAGEIFYDPGNMTINTIKYQTFAGTSGQLSASFNPTRTGSYKVCCRAWNDSVAECRPSAYVDHIPRYACLGPQVCKDVTVVSGPTPTATPTPTRPTITPTPKNGNPCAAYNGSVTQCDAHGPACAYYYCSNQCWPRGTPNCDAGCISQCSIQPKPTDVITITPTSKPTNPCAAYNGSVTQCDAHGPACAYYYCSNQCWPRGTSNCAAGCKQYCN